MTLDGEARAQRVDGLVAARADEMVALRRTLHADPELSWEEHRTTARLADLLRAEGLDPRPLPTDTGLVVDIGDADAGPTVMLRADLDALPLDDDKPVPYRSTVAGVCHACGHDVHTAVVAGAVLALAALDPAERGGRVRVLFQPAEEAIPGGASRLYDTWVMDDVTQVFALHCDPGLEVGRVGVRVGPITSAADRVHVRLKGPGGHTARPHLTTDLVHVAARVISDVPAELVKLTDPADAATLVFGAVRAGLAPNVIPTEAEVAGTLRVRGRTTWDRAPALLEQLIAAAAEPFGATWDLSYDRGSPPVENDAVAAEAMSHAVILSLGPEALTEAEQSVGSEDFSWLLERAPGAYGRLGVRAGPPDERRDLHAGAFDVAEDAIAVGSRVLALTALTALAEGS